MSYDVFQPIHPMVVAEEERYKVPDDFFSVGHNGKNCLRTIEYDIDNNCFLPAGKPQTVRSLFFEQCDDKKRMFEDFFVLRMIQDRANRISTSLIERDDRAEDILRKGVSVGDVKYNVVGCSNSQVRSKSFVLMKGSRDECDKYLKLFIPNIVKLEEKKGIAKRTKYAGLLFTGCQYIAELPKQWTWKENKDFENGSYNFTDGCGLISISLATEIMSKNKELEKKWKSTGIPSVWQIRYYGKGHLCKGVLVVDYSEPKKKVMTMRKSMLKIEIGNDDRKVIKCLEGKIGIVETSQNRLIGKLNKQIVSLLSDSVPNEVMISLQKRHLDALIKARTDAVEASKCLALYGKWEMFRCFLLRYSKLLKPVAYNSIPRTIETLDNEKLKIPLEHSRLLFGASLPEHLHSHLNEEECIVFTEEGIENPLGPVLVSRSPSYSPGDVRVLTAVRPPQDNQNVFSKLRNAILFSTRGKRPDPDKMSGGDLDGDKFLVIWNPRLLDHLDKIKRVPQSYVVQQSTTIEDDEEKERGCIQEDWIRYIARWENTLLAEIDSCFSKLATEKGVSSTQCQELCDLFSNAVDQTPTAVLKQLKNLKGQCSDFTNDKDPPIWEVLLHKQIECSEELRRRNRQPSDNEWEQFYNVLLNQPTHHVTRLLYENEDFNFLQCVPSKVLEQIHTYWSKICKNCKKFNTESCCTPTFDVNPIDGCSEGIQCNNIKCMLVHPSVESYRKYWNKRVEDEMLQFIGPIKKHLHAQDEIIEEQKKRRNKSMDRLQYAQEKYRKEMDDFAKKQRILDLCKELINTIKKKEENLEILKQKIKPTTKKKIKNWVLKVFCKTPTLSPEEQLALSNHTSCETEINCCYKKCNDQEAHVRSMLSENEECISIEKNISLDKCNAGNFEESKIHLLQFENLISKVEKSDVMAKPKIDDVPFDIDCIDYSIKVIESNLEELRLMLQYVINLNELQMKCEKVSKCISLCHSYISKAKTESLSSTDICSMHNTLVSSLKDFPRDIAIIADDPVLSFEFVLSELIRCESYNKCNLDKLKKRISKPLKSIMLYKEAIQKKESQIEFFKDLRKTIYNPHTETDALREYEKLLHKSRCFDLALCALQNEVNVRFPATEISNQRTIQEKDKIQNTNELQLCVQREKKRCLREQSDNRLPIYSKRNEILEALFDFNVVIVVAHTGSGKSTQVPQYLADDLHHVLVESSSVFPRVVCTQPRRVAAVRIAERVALEYCGAVPISSQTKPEVIKSSDTITENIARVGAYPLYSTLSAAEQDRALDENDRQGFYSDPPQVNIGQNKKQSSLLDPKTVQESAIKSQGDVGGWVGYQIGSKGKTGQELKDCRKIGKDTRIEFVTEGLLLHKLKRNLNSYDCIVIDEAHERGRDTDLLLAFLRRIVIEEKKSLKVVVMSASIDQRTFSNYFGGCPIVECQGKMFEVEDVFLDEKSEEIRPVSVSLSPAPATTNIPSAKVVDLLYEKIVNGPADVPNGDVLIFLPGKREIMDCVDLITQRETEEKKTRTVNLSKTRKVVCCTNIAETSLTIPGVRFVIDGGKAKQMIYDYKLRVSALKLQNCSQASAKQRKGRAGRVQTGWCYCLYTNNHFQTVMPEFDEPEMKRCSIDELYLYSLSVYGSTLETINLMDDAQPSKDSVKWARERLFDLGFIKLNRQDEILLTKDGRYAHDNVGDLSLECSKMIIEARKFDVMTETITIAVMLMEQSNLLVSQVEKKIEEARLQLKHERGDHIALLNIYTKFRSFTSDKKATEWCKKYEINIETLLRAKQTIARIYKAIKANINYGKIKGSKYSDSELHDVISQVLVCGYFHNIAELHDVNYVRSGYSMITPQNYGNFLKMSCLEVDLLKINLSKNSSLVTHGDNTKNTYVVFDKLIQTGSGSIFMQNATKIKALWIEEHAAERWRRSIGLRRINENEITSYVLHVFVHFIGPEILGRKKMGCSDVLKKIENFSNAKLNVLKDACEVRVYGSMKEIRRATSNIIESLSGYLNEFQRNIEVHNYGLSSCRIGTGLIVHEFDDISAQLVNNYDLVESGVVIVFHQPEDKENAIQWTTSLVNRSFEVFQCDKFTKLTFKSVSDARFVVNEFNSNTILWSSNVQCRLSNEIHIPVKRTSLYPNFESRFSSRFPNIQIKTRYNEFVLIARKRQNTNQIQHMVEEIVSERYFGTIVETVILADPLSQIICDVALEKSMEWINDTTINTNCWVHIQSNTPRFEVMVEGEPTNRTETMDNILRKIDEIRMDISQYNFKFVFYNQWSLNRLQFSKIFKYLEMLRNKYPNVNMELIGGAEKKGDKALPMLKVRSYNITKGAAMWKEIKALLHSCSTSIMESNDGGSDSSSCSQLKRATTQHELFKTESGIIMSLIVDGNSGGGDDDFDGLKESLGINLTPAIVSCDTNDAGLPVKPQSINGIVCCVICNREMKKNQKSEKNSSEIIVDIKKTSVSGVIEEEGRSLRLCGCVYCQLCLENVIWMQLRSDETYKRHTNVTCFICYTAITPNDLVKIVKRKMRRKFFNQALKNRILSEDYSSDKIAEECGHCRTLLLRPTQPYGAYRCRKCQAVFCCRCGAPIKNRIEFNTHQSCLNCRSVEKEEWRNNDYHCAW